MKNLWYLILFAFLFVTVLVRASDYAIMRTSFVMPGGGTGTNVVIVPVPNSSQMADGEVIEIDATGGAGQDTCTVYRISGDLKFTNTLTTATSPSQTMVYLPATSTNILASSSQSSDFLKLVETGTNTPNVALYWKIHAMGIR
jgi:hypothetical protein